MNEDFWSVDEEHFDLRAVFERRRNPHPESGMVDDVTWVEFDLGCVGLRFIDDAALHQLVIVRGPGLAWLRSPRTIFFSSLSRLDEAGGFPRQVRLVGMLGGAGVAVNPCRLRPSDGFDCVRQHELAAPTP